MKKSESPNSQEQSESQLLIQAAQQKDVFERLMKTSTALLSGRTLDEVLQVILQGVKESGFDRVRLFLISSDGKHLIGVKQTGMDEGWVDGIQWSIAGDVHFQALMINHSPQIVPFDSSAPDPNRDRFKKQGVEWATVPLLSQNRIIGQVVVDNKFSRRKIQEAELTTLAIFGMQAATAIEKASLTDRNEKKLKLLSNLADATAVIIGQLSKVSLTELLTLVAKYSSELLEAEVCSVFLCRGTNDLILEAGYGYRPGSFQQGLKTPILGGGKSGFTGFVAHEGALVNLHGDELLNHPAILEKRNNFSPSGSCNSVLVLPLKQKNDQGETLVALIRADNKKDQYGQAHSAYAFTKEDEWILRIFGEVIVVCLESAKKVEHRKLLVRNLPQAVIAIDDKGNVTEFNHEASRILGYMPQEVLGKKVSLLYDDPEEPKRVGNQLSSTVNGQLNNYPTRIRTKSGRAVPIILTAYCLNDNRGRSGSVGLFEDLSNSEAYKKQLEISLHAIRTVAEADNLELGLQRLAELLTTRFPRTYCGVLLYDKRGNFLIEKSADYGKEKKKSSATRRQIPLDDYPGLLELLKIGKPRILRLNSDPLTRSNLEKLNATQGFNPPIQSLVVLPIKLGDRLLGVIDLAEICAEEDSLFPDDCCVNLHLAAAIATQSALFVDRILANERDRTQLFSFYEVSSSLKEQTDPEILLQAIVEETRKAAGAVSVDLVLIDQQNRVERIFSLPERQREYVVRPNGISIQVFRSGREKRFSNLDLSKGEVNPALQENAKAAICLPLSLPNRRIGVMWVRYDDQQQFFDQEIVALQLYVNQAAMALEDAREKARQKRVQKAAEALADKTDLRSVSQQILASTCEVLKADAVIFGFFDHTNNTFVRRFSAQNGLDNKLWEQYQSLAMGENTTAHRLLEKGVVLINDLNDSNEAQILGDTTKHLLNTTGVKSFQAFTLKVGQERVGIVCAIYFKPYSFDEKRQLTAANFARYAALAVKKAKLFEQLNKTNEAASAVAKVTVLGQRQATLAAIVKEIKDVTECDAVVLFEYDREKKRLQPPTIKGLNFPERALRANEVQDDPLVLKALESNEPYKVIQVTSHPDYQDRRFAKDENIASCVVLPLQAKENRVGVLFVNFRKDRNFTVEELATMQLFADQAALAIHYAQSTEANERKLHELEALEALSSDLREAQDLQKMMDRTVALAGQKLGVDFCNLILPNRNHELVLRAQYGWKPPLTTFILGLGDNSQAGYTIQRGEPIHVVDYKNETRFKVMEHLLNSGVVSGLSVPLFRDNEKVGALLAFSKSAREFTDEEVRFFCLIANHAAMAMRSMEQYEDLYRRDKHLQAVHNANKAILENFGDEQQVLDQIIEEAVKSVNKPADTKAVIGTLQLYDSEKNEMVIRSSYPPATYSLLFACVENGRWSLDKEKAPRGKIGVTGRTVLSGQSQIVGDLSQDNDYIQYTESSKSELSVPLKLNGKTLGAINVESDQLNAFDDYDRVALEALADHAVVAMNISETYEDLRQTKGIVGTRTALAWMGLANNAWRHTIAGEAAELGNRITLMREYLKQDKIQDQRIYQHLTQMEQLAKNIQERPVTPPLSSEEGKAVINLNDLILERVRQLQQNDRSKGITLVCDSSNESPLRVDLSPEWFRRAFDILIDNGIRAVRSISPPDPTRHLVSIKTSLSGKFVELRVKDCGEGISAENQKRIFHHEVESKNGHGVGLLLAQAIVETYGGSIKIEKTNSEGTEMLIQIPHYSREELSC